MLKVESICLFVLPSMMFLLQSFNTDVPWEMWDVDVPIVVFVPVEFLAFVVAAFPVHCLQECQTTNAMCLCVALFPMGCALKHVDFN